MKVYLDLCVYNRPFDYQGQTRIALESNAFIYVLEEIEGGSYDLVVSEALMYENSKNPDEEAVIVLAHGDEYTGPMWTKLMKRTVTHICGKTGISYGDWAFVHVGQSYGQALGAIAEAAEHRKRVLLVGCYLSMGVDKMHQRYMKNFSRGAMPGMENPLAGKEIVTAGDGLLPDPRVAQWIADIAVKAL